MTATVPSPAWHIRAGRCGRPRRIPARSTTILGPPKPRLDQPIAVSLEDLVPQDHFYRLLEAKLDLGFVRDWAHELYAERGRPSIAPVVFVKLQLVMFFEGIRSERQLIETTSLNLAHRWYLGHTLDETLPDHSSLTRIRQRLRVDIFGRFFEKVVDLAVAVVIGAAFGAIVTSLVTNIITPIIAALFGQPDFSALSFTLNGSEILYGAFLNSVIGFLIIAIAIFFLVVKPMNAMMTRMRTEPTPDPLTGKCPLCLSEVQLGALRCPFCTQEIEAIAA